MKNVFADYKPEEFNRLCNQLLGFSEEKMPADLKDKDSAREPFKYLSGDKSVESLNGGLHHKYYANLAYSAYEAFANKFCAQPPRYLVKHLIENRVPLADACTKLFEYKLTKFEYQQMIKDVCQDAYHLPAGYGRHAWNSKIGLTETKRFNPCDVYWDHTAKDYASANYVIERHRTTRIQFAYKYGFKLAYKLKKAENSETLQRAELASNEDAHDLDEIEYYLLWSRYCGVKRVYPFVKEWPSEQEEEWLHISREDGKPGEPWPLEFAEDEWHLTPLELTPVNGQLGGVSVWKAGKPLYLMLQDLLGATMKASEESAKKILAYPQVLDSLMQRVRSASGTLTLVGYDPAINQIADIEKAIKLIEMPGPDANLLKAFEQVTSLWQESTGYNAVSAIQPSGVETAAEATTLADAATNRIAGLQGAVERWVKKIGSKELTCDLSRVPKRSSVRVKRSEYLDGEGEFPDRNQKELIHDVAYSDAVLLEKGVADPADGRTQLDLREKKKAESVLRAGFGLGMQVDPQTVQQMAEQAAQSVPLSAEVEVRSRYGIPMDAEVEIVTPGAEQFIGQRLAQFWEEDMTPRQINSELLVAIQLGSSSPTGRMQRMNEVLMMLKTLEPKLYELQQWDSLALIYNAVIDASEIETLRECKFTGDEFRKGYEAMQQQQADAAAAQAQAQADAENQHKPLDPNVAAKAEAEKVKGSSSLEKQKLENEHLQMKGEIEEARDRRRSESQLMQARMNGMMP